MSLVAVAMVSRRVGLRASVEDRQSAPTPWSALMVVLDCATPHTQWMSEAGRKICRLLRHKLPPNAGIGRI